VTDEPHIRPVTPLLDKVRSPADLRGMSDADLARLAEELRAETISAVSVTGGHLGAGLGVVELTVAIHAVFDTPKDKLIWDVGHQCYPHKILTGRRDRIRTLRQGGGLSGFTKRAESEYDPFGAAHSSTSISAGLGFAMGRELGQSQVGDVICVIGDGALSAGMAYEAMNNAGHLDKRLVVILNDNDMSIAPPVGAMSAYLARLLSGGVYDTIREAAKSALSLMPEPFREGARRFEEYAKGMAVGGTLFEELGFTYIGPIDGHNMGHLLPVLRNVKERAHGPVLIHVVTQKGKGYAPAEQAADKYHGVSKFDVITGAQKKTPTNAPSYTKVFAQSLVKEAETDGRIVAITAAMPDGTGLNLFADRFPERCFDVGIAEQHAVTFAAGLAATGIKPFCAIYSTFLQRGYDQVVHDVALQGLPVRFAIDRAGLVGADGPTHAGAFDVGYLSNLPGFVVMAAADEAELVHMVATAAAHDAGPIAFRFPRGEGVGVEMPEKGQPLPIGKGRIVKQGKTVALLRMPEGGRGAGGAGAFDHRRRRAVLEAAGPRPDPDPRHDARDADHRRGGGEGRFRRPCAASPGRRGRARSWAEGPHHDAAGHLHRSGRAGEDVRRRAAGRQGHRRDRAEGAGRRQGGGRGRGRRAGVSLISTRLDQRLVELGLAPTRSRAQALVKAGAVTVDGAPASKPSQGVAEGTEIAVNAAALPWVSRAALKLVHALDAFGLDPSGAVALDVGASTGGFTEVLLARGATRVYALDVGKGQLHPTLAADPRVVSLEGVNARAIPEGLVPEVDWVVSDVSFISLEKALPGPLALAKPGAVLVALIKPQFEAGPDRVGKGGIVKDAAVHEEVRARIRAFLQGSGWAVLGEADSPILGGDGNAEFLIAARKGAA